MLHTIFGMAAGLLALVAFVPYIIGTMKGTVRPNRASWLVLAVNGCALSASYIAGGATTTAWLAGAYALGPVIIFALSLHHGEKGWSRFDITCLAGAAGGLVLWGVTGSPRLAIATGIAVDFLGILPTIRKILRKNAGGDGESLVSWAMFLFSAALALVGIETWTAEIAAYPVYMTLGNTFIVVSIVVARRR